MVLRRVLLLLLLLLLVAGCATGSASIGADQVVAWDDPDRSFVARHDLERPLGALDSHRVVRLVRTMFPDAVITEGEFSATFDLDSPETATAVMECARWIDGMMMALRSGRKDGGAVPSSPAGFVSETVRRYLLVDPPVEIPDWNGVLLVLEKEAIWRSAPHTAGVGAILIAGVLIREPLSDRRRERAVALLGRTTATREIPPWLSWASYSMWSKRDFFAREETP